MDKNQYNVLLVEDVPLAQIAATYILEDLNCNTDVAETGSDALQLACEKYYDVIFMDIGLPDTDGFRLTDDIRRSQGKNHLTQIYALTAHLDKDYQQQAEAVGMNGFLQKPLTEEKLNNVLKKIKRSPEKHADNQQ
ncbi:MAG: response regulator [Gammaproteobacteria bacterium]|nr:response regulator [Gammaproteobacteria bacterium]